MNFISNIEIKNFRIHKNINIELNQNLTIITGKNGSGKTSILEAIYISLRGKSFKGSLRNIINSNSKGWFVKTIIGDDEIKINLNIEDYNITKQFNINNNKFKTLPYKYKKPVVLFEPDDMRIIIGSPNKRRNYIDNIICQYDSQYGSYLNKYEKVLSQRNYLLKNKNLKNEDLHIWNISLSEHGAYIIKKRAELLKEINEKIINIYKNLSNTDDIVNLKYSEKETTSTQQSLLNELEKNLKKDKITNSTSVGPHRHDIYIYINNKEAKNTASRGEIRTIILALKFFEIDLIEQKTDQKPIILLDDVYSELDEIRQKKLNSYTKKNQVVISSVNNIDEIKSNNKKIIVL